MNTQLLCLFTTKDELDKSIEFILENYTLTNPNVFILENKSKPEEAFITFNVSKGSAAIASEWKTILVHRKKQSNTIYTINALNEVIKSKNGGQLDNSYQLEWEEYRNCILTTSNTGYKKIPTKVFKSFNTQENESTY
jgi:hypothetical protein